MRTDCLINGDNAYLEDKECRKILNLKIHSCIVIVVGNYPRSYHLPGQTNIYMCNYGN